MNYELFFLPLHSKNGRIHFVAATVFTKIRIIMDDYPADSCKRKARG